jgi:hypothetical protein
VADAPPLEHSRNERPIPATKHAVKDVVALDFGDAEQLRTLARCGSFVDRDGEVGDLAL